jgi:hydrogenase maturation protein HypF
MSARRWLVTGQVQGVGFRPYVYRLARQHGLRGWVKNRVGEVEIFAEGEAQVLLAFEHDLPRLAPPLARVEIAEARDATPESCADFQILPSVAGDKPRIYVPPDYFACDDCLRELENPADRRYRYPFINCTQCGPRYTLITRLPYDRPNTTMAEFPLCAECAAEYRDPANRRFHAQPVACPVCGPQLQWRAAGLPEQTGEAALQAAVSALAVGHLIAVKGIGGYHLLCDANNDAAIRRLRDLKPRPAKPLAVLLPRRGENGLAVARQIFDLTPEEAAALASPMRPIVLARQQPGQTLLSPLLAPDLNEIGVMLPYSPLHHLLLQAHGRPLVATSANVSGEPVLTENAEVEARLAHLAQGFLHHNRPIQRPADDPVLRRIAGKMRPLRLGRGNAPLELPLPARLAQPVLAVGGHLKNTVALAWEDRVVISPHIGELDAPRSQAVFEQVIGELQALYQIQARRIVCDAHPEYASTRWAKRSGLPLTQVFHHYAHASALAGEFSSEKQNWLVFTWDGVGYGADGTLWGGETLHGRPGHWQRVASLRPFLLPGGERAARQAWRCALSVCWEAGMEWSDAPADKDIALLRHAWQRRLNCPQTSAAGRLFDAAAALIGLIQESRYEGHAAMLLEAAAGERRAKSLSLVPKLQLGNPVLEAPASSVRKASWSLQDCVPNVDVGNELVWQTDWSPLLPYLQDQTLSQAERAAGFHAALAQAIADQAETLRRELEFSQVGLSGGVFQNRLLAELAIEKLQAAGFQVFLPEKAPMNDAGLSFGQVLELLMV